MLSSRSVKTNLGKLPVEIASPRRVTIRRKIRQFTWRAALVGAVAGFGIGVSQHGPGTSNESRPAAARAILGETALGGAAGGTAGLVGAVAYGWIGGPAGAVAALGIGAIVAAGTHQALPVLARVPREIEPAPKPLWNLEEVSFSPVFVDRDIKEEAPPPPPPYDGPWNDEVVFLGMNSGPTKRATGIMRRHARLEIILGSHPQDQVRVGSRAYDLQTLPGIQQFCATLGFDNAHTSKIARAFVMCESGARDELAGLALVWARGEHGQHIPSRLVLAGHSNGDGVWGDDNGSLRLGPLLALSRALPHASSQIEDAFVTGCYSGGEVTMDQYLLIFPRAKTIWAYEAQAPGVDNGATLDQAGWERATRGRSMLVPSSLASASGGKNLAIWTRQDIGGGKYHANRPIVDVNALRGKVQWMEEHFYRPALRGEESTTDQGFLIPIRITDPHTGLVRQYYSWLVRLTQSKELPEDERAGWVAKKHQTIRLLYYATNVAPHFANFYRTEIHRGYALMGLPCPDFARLPRAQALSSVDRYIQKLELSKKPSSEAEQVGTLLERGIKDLDPGVMPDGWV